MKLSQPEVSTIDNALRIAIEVFKVDVEQTGEPRIAEQFRKQIRECEALLERIENEG